MCVVQWNGFQWIVTEDNCPTGQHCVIPTQPGSVPFEYAIVDCAA